jgi:hypothetical protein
MSEDQIIERVARLIDPGAWGVGYIGAHAADYQAGDQADARKIAQNIIQGLGLHEERTHRDIEPCRSYWTRLVTDWQEDTQ